MFIKRAGTALIAECLGCHKTGPRWRAFVWRTGSQAETKALYLQSSVFRV